MTTLPTDAPPAPSLAWDCRQRPVVEALYERLGRALLLRARRLVGEESAREIVQETYTRLWDAGPAFATELAAFTWLYRVSHNLTVDLMRSAASRLTASDDDALAALQAPGSSPDEIAVARRTLERFGKRLDEREASAYVYRHVDRMTLEEIAEHLGLSTKTVGRLLDKVEQKLAKLRVELHDKTARRIRRPAGSGRFAVF